MRYAIALLSALMLLPVAGWAQGKLEVDDISHHPFETDFPAGGRLNLHIRSAEIHVIGNDESRLTVHITGSEGRRSTDMTARFERTGNSGELHVTGGPHNEVTITVQVPRKSNLFVRIPAGDVGVKGITGDKDIELHAGDLTIDVGNPADYESVAASVTSGDLEAPPFGESHGGLFRSFKKSGNGRYSLVAHVGAGDLKLE